MSDVPEMVERVREAWEAEYPLWICRDARWLKLGCQVCREVPNGAAGEFTETHSFKTMEEADEMFEYIRGNACARSAIQAMREEDLRQQSRAEKVPNQKPR